MIVIINIYMIKCCNNNSKEILFIPIVPTRRPREVRLLIQVTKSKTSNAGRSKFKSCVLKSVTLTVRTKVKFLALSNYFLKVRPKFPSGSSTRTATLLVC